MTDEQIAYDFALAISAGNVNEEGTCHINNCNDCKATKACDILCDSREGTWGFKFESIVQSRLNKIFKENPELAI